MELVKNTKSDPENLLQWGVYQVYHETPQLSQLSLMQAAGLNGGHLAVRTET